MRAAVTRFAAPRLLVRFALLESRWPANSRDCRLRHVHCPAKTHAEALPSYNCLHALYSSQDARDFVDCAYSDIEEGSEGTMGDAKSTSTASSSTKRKRSAPAFYAVKVGYTPGIYQSWEDAKQQTSGYKNSIFKKFATLTDAEEFMKGEGSSAIRAGKTKYYGVQAGYTPGVYTDWPAVLEQVTGFKGGKQKRFDTWEEAQAYVDEGLFAPSATSTPISMKGHLDSTTPSGVESRKSSKKQKKLDGSAKVAATNVEYEAGFGPLPLDAEDGFDRTLKHGLAYGSELEYKTTEELGLRKLQPTGDFEGTLEIYTDGAAKGNGQLGAYAGFGIWFGPNDPRNNRGPLAGEKQTNQRAELTAIGRAVDIVPIDRDAKIYTDSHYSMKCLTDWFQSWESKGWKNSAGKPVENRDLIEPILARLREREKARAKTQIVWVKAHNGNIGNEAADRLANEGAEEKRIEIEVEKLAKFSAEREKHDPERMVNGFMDQNEY